MKSQLSFQQLELTAHSRLGSTQLARRGRDVEAVFVQGHQVPQLLKFHLVRRAVYRQGRRRVAVERCIAAMLNCRTHENGSQDQRKPKVFAEQTRAWFWIHRYRL
jgi:hypothetical protein